jgi:hypothetical protein
MLNNLYQGGLGRQPRYILPKINSTSHYYIINP